MARIDALAKLTGRAVYAADVDLPGLCHAAVARSPFPHARVVAVDPGPAREVPGVIGVFTAADLSPGRYGRRVRDIPLLAGPEARFAGERVVAVVAESRIVAERAAARVRIEYEELPAALGAEEALAPTAPAVHEAAWSYPGAVVTPDDPPNLQSRVLHGSPEEAERALAASAHLVDRTYRLAAGHQGYLEPQACAARVDPDGRVHVWMANKSPYRLRHQLAECLELDPELIEIHPVTIGGDFGGKGSPMDAPLCVELARRTGRPVMLVERYHEDLTSANPRHSGRVRVRVGCDGEGRLTGFHVDALFDGGAYAGFKPLPTVTLHGLEEVGSSYRVPAAAVEVRICYTHTVPRGHMRSRGHPRPSSPSSRLWTSWPTRPASTRSRSGGATCSPTASPTPGARPGWRRAVVPPWRRRWTPTVRWPCPRVGVTGAGSRSTTGRPGPAGPASAWCRTETA